MDARLGNPVFRGALYFVVAVIVYRIVAAIMNGIDGNDVLYALITGAVIGAFGLSVGLVRARP